LRHRAADDAKAALRFRVGRVIAADLAATLIRRKIACRKLPTLFRFMDSPMSCSFLFRPQTPDDLPAVDALHEESFGPGRFARTAYRIREAARVPPAIALTAWDGMLLIGAIQFSAITIGGKRGSALLGPLAIAATYKNKGCGLRLMQDGLAEAEGLGFELVVLIGDLPYYQRAGFGVILPGRITLPGPADPARFLAAELTAGALPRFSGMVAPDNEPRPVLVSPAFAVPG
jgi:predicted N-acetyltransferase YhbS